MRCILLAAIFSVGFTQAAPAQLHTTLDASLPSLQSEGDADATYCRPPQQLADSRLMGPRVCMTNRKWDQLHSQGLEISADGKSTITCRIASTVAATQSNVDCYKGRLP